VVDGDSRSKRRELELLLEMIERRRETEGDAMLGSAVESRVRKRLKELDKEEQGER